VFSSSIAIFRIRKILWERFIIVGITAKIKIDLATKTANIITTPLASNASIGLPLSLKKLVFKPISISADGWKAQREDREKAVCIRA
jgi:hypothetical protein